mmetsp:Transcript_72008/g.185736  ORF Transcript_72008/g.185736 Transcript_72008/m.185736 type:complete len:273 (+) Transcript_72008:1912-2730(+)
MLDVRTNADDLAIAFATDAQGLSGHLRRDRPDRHEHVAEVQRPERGPDLHLACCWRPPLRQVGLGALRASRRVHADSEGCLVACNHHRCAGQGWFLHLISEDLPVACAHDGVRDPETLGDRPHLLRRAHHGLGAHLDCGRGRNLGEGSVLQRHKPGRRACHGLAHLLAAAPHVLERLGSHRDDLGDVALGGAARHLRQGQRRRLRAAREPEAARLGRHLLRHALVQLQRRCRVEDRQLEALDEACHRASCIEQLDVHLPVVEASPCVDWRRR